MKEPTELLAWYKNSYVWLLISGPLLVIIASIITVYLAITHPDPAIEDYYKKGIEINKTLNAKSDGMVPAVQARNHAQTGFATKEQAD